MQTNAMTGGQVAAFTRNTVSSFSFFIFPQFSFCIFIDDVLSFAYVITDILIIIKTCEVVLVGGCTDDR